MGGLVRLGPMRSEKLEVQFHGWGCSGEPVSCFAKRSLGHLDCPEKWQRKANP